MIARKAEEKSRRELSDRETRENETLRNYAILIAVGNALVLLAALRNERRNRNPSRVDTTELAISGLAVHKLARLVAKDKVTRPLRAPFTIFEDSSGAAEVDETERGRGFRRTIGELISCPYCMSFWSAAFLGLGYAFRPGLARTFAWILAMTNVSHFLNQIYDKAKALNK